MEEEIDALFLGKNDSDIQESSIKDLETCSATLGDLDPYIDIIKGKMGSIKMDYDLYYIKLERLAKEMETIEQENTKLENEILYQTSIYNRLRDLLINLEIKEEHFISLETDPLDSSEGVTRIEKALKVLSGFDIQEYTIRVVEEKKERITTALRLFYKRFIKFLSNFFVTTTESRELNIHNELYRRMKVYKDIYAYSKQFSDFYAVLCRVYLKHAQKLYDREMEHHLSVVHKLLANSKEKVEECISDLLQTYQSLIKCEINFLKSMSIDSDATDIFSNTNQIISDFIQDVYYISPLPTINYLDTHWVSSDLKVYCDLQENLKVIVGTLKKKFLNKEMEVKDKEESLRRFKEILRISKLKDLNSILFNFHKERILRGRDGILEEIEAKRLLEELILLYDEDEGENVECINEAIKKKLIEFVYEEGDSKVFERLKKLLNEMKGGENFKNQMHKEMYDILKETVDDKETLRKTLNV